MFVKFKKVLHRYRKLIILFISLIIFLMVLNDVLGKEIIFYDELAYNILVSHRSTFLTSVMKIITNFGSGFTLVAICFLIFAITKNRIKAITVSLNLLLITIINYILKILIQRPRPSGFNIIEENGYSFPSGHSMISTAFYGLLIYLAYKNIKNKALKRFICIFLFILIILIAISRVYLGVHYASDVIGGFLVSVVYLMLFITIVPRFLKIIDEKDNKNT